MRSIGVPAALGFNYSKWDSLDVSDSEDEDGKDTAAILQQQREISEAADAQQKLRALINEHQSGKPLEPPDEVKDILDEPLWCDQPGNVSAAEAADQGPAESSHQQGAGQQAAAPGGGGGASAFSKKTVAPVSACAAVAEVPRARAQRRDFSDWDKLKLDDSDSDDVADKGEGGRGVGAGKPPEEVEKLRQLMQLQEGLNKMKEDRERRHALIQRREQRILERDGTGHT
jgi:hypothetical protein